MHAFAGASAQRRRERGDGLVEFALLLPPLLLILLAILDLGRGVYAYHVVANCAREGARIARISSDANAVTAAAQAAAAGLDPARLSVALTQPTETTVRVDVTYTFELVTPLLANVLGTDSFLLHSAATMYTGY